MEIHEIGPCKLLDTAGVDEGGTLGAKKFTKAISAVKESDLVLFVIDPINFRMAPFKDVFDLAQRRGKTSALVFNRFRNAKSDFSKAQAAVAAQIAQITKKSLPSITVSAIDREQTYSEVVPFIANLKKQAPNPPLIPDKFLGPDKTIFLNIPLDVESPSGRLLRPQTMVIEYALRKFTSVNSFCMNLKEGRSPNFEAERARYLRALEVSRPSLAITDSQAIDLMSKWTPPQIPITTFSVTMANIQTGGKLREFAKGIEKMGKLQPGDRVLICEACNHDRIGDDIGTVQLPAKPRRLCPWIEIDWAFGRAYAEKKLTDYALAFHCGGCMISRQQMAARVQDLLETGVPVINYGLALSWLASPSLALERVLKPWE
jgi:[FeFe] hydrogenase H-cluster maturation GTPase HydF